MCAEGETAIPMNSHILLVEDEPGLVLTLSDRLRSEGYEVEALYDGTEVVERATRTHFGLIILDVMLPGKGGFEVCQELRQRGFSTPNPNAHRAHTDGRQSKGAQDRSRRLFDQAL